MDDFNEFWKAAGTYIWFILLAIVGGTVNYVSRVRRDPNLSFSIIEMLGEWFASGFVGLMTAYACAYLEWPFPLTAALCGISGHLAGRLVFMLDVRGQAIIDSTIDKWVGKK